MNLCWESGSMLQVNQRAGAKAGDLAAQARYSIV